VTEGTSAACRREAALGCAYTGRGCSPSPVRQAFVKTRPMAFAYEPGIYKTTKYLPGHEAQVGPDQLILIRTDGDFAPASVLLPVANTNNQWRFQMPGIKIPAASLNWGDSLVKLPHEGFYRLTREFTFGDKGKWIENAIVQLGYTRKAEPILFIAQRRSPLTSNELWFSDKGVKIELEQVDEMLVPLAWYQEPEKKDAAGNN
jgi:hypothetical protein